MAKRKPVMTLAEAMAGMPPDFAFFADHFSTHVQPKLLAREEDRKAAIRHQNIFLLLGVGVFIAALGAGFLFGGEEGPLFGGFFGFIAGIGLAAWGSVPIGKLAKETKLMLVEPVAAEFGMHFDVAPPVPPEINHIREMGLVSRWDRAKYEDQLTGERADAPFKFFEAHLEEKRTTTDSKGRTRTTWVTVFRGQCLTVRFHKPFVGVTKVYRDAGIFNVLMKMGQKYPRVRLEDPVFEKAFEVYGSDQIEARFILTPDFMERLQLLERTFQGKQLRCAFSGGEMLLCVEGKNLLEPGSMYRPMDDLRRVREMLEDFAAIFLLIDSMAQRLTPDALRNEPPA